MSIHIVRAVCVLGAIVATSLVMSRVPSTESVSPLIWGTAFLAVFLSELCAITFPVWPVSVPVSLGIATAAIRVVGFEVTALGLVFGVVAGSIANRQIGAMLIRAAALVMALCAATLIGGEAMIQTIVGCAVFAVIDTLATPSTRESFLDGRWLNHLAMVAATIFVVCAVNWAALRLTSQPYALMAVVVPIFLGHLVIKKSVSNADTYVTTLAALTNMLQAAHPYTHGHLERVARMAEKVALRLGLGPERAAMVRDAAILHDIGKIAIDEAILDKPAKLTEEEFAHVKLHSEFGAKILGQCPQLRSLAPWIHAHHERPDGTGYPNSLPDAEIPIESKIISVADAFDAMVGSTHPSTHRSYRTPMTVDQALAELDRCGGTQFDPQVVAVFTDVALEEAI